ncbi:hypothetical protein [Photobacterium nomapromontoriensis]|uniref:hypothetical protein n=1 Tax=Photobacterium nomapromontoriensis TaxID=2910237 RepID=UPI003D0F1E01
MRRFITITQILLLGCVLVVTGCAENTLTAAKGAEALVYPEHHTYQFTLTGRSGPAEVEIERAIFDARQSDHDFDVTISYRSTRGQVVANRQLAKLKALGVSSEQYRSQYVLSLSSDVKVDIKLTRLLAETCQPETIEQLALSRGCFVDVMRMKQVARPARLMGE